MLYESEWQLLQRAQQEGMAFVEQERTRRGVLPATPLQVRVPQEKWLAFVEMHRIITVSRKRIQPPSIIIELHGTARHVSATASPYRPPPARFCAACGYGMTGESDKP